MGHLPGGAVVPVMKSGRVLIDTHTARVHLIQGEHHLVAAFPADLAAAAWSKLRRLGVEVRMGAQVVEITADGVVAEGERPPSIPWPQSTTPTMPTQRSIPQR
jgi:NADH dehydrogenase FAD-containing subunit